MSYVLSLDEVDRDAVRCVGGKGAQLGELSRVTGVDVPPGFCVTTAAFDRFVAQTPSLDERLGRLSRSAVGDGVASDALGAAIRTTIERAAVPDQVASAIRAALTRIGEPTPVAVRSSATTEDLPTASSAGQLDSFLNVVGPEAVLDHVRRCWASLFTERAVAYRREHGIDPRGGGMGIVVQRMVPARVSGVLFTADPLTGNRTVTVVEAAPGLGEAFVAGRRNADAYTVRDGVLLSTATAVQRALTETEVLALAALGRRIEDHFGAPQDIEWCLSDDGVQIVQSRPITTLFPVPAESDGAVHVYISVGHQQMYTDAFTPFGLSVRQLTTPRPFAQAGGRQFVDVTRLLATPTGRTSLIDGFLRSDPLIGDALRTVADRPGFLPALPDDAVQVPAGIRPTEPIDADPELVSELIAVSRASIATLERAIEPLSGSALFDFILDDMQEMRRLLFDPRSLPVIMTGMEAARWLNENLEAWLGERSVADTLAQSAPGNVTAEMGLALLDVADVIRPHAEVVALLRRADGDGFLDELAALDGGEPAADTIRAFLQEYGMRCVGEIDITRPRFSEQPSVLLPAILANVDNFSPGEASRRFERGRRNAEDKEREILDRLGSMPDGEARVAETGRMIDRVRAFAGYREYPKYGLVRRYFVYKQALLAELRRMVDRGLLSEPEDGFFLTMEELRELADGAPVDDDLIRRRRERFAQDQALVPPRVFTSEGEVIRGAYHRGDRPAGALIGLPVSAGTVEGRARVVLDIADAELGADDILVTPFTDPSWTPLFVAVRGLITEVGGLMTHGAVIAREYGLPAVVGVEGATARIPDGQWIRLHGTEGYVELLPEPDGPPSTLA